MPSNTAALLMIIYVLGRSVRNFTSCLCFCGFVNLQLRDQT